MGPNLTVDEHAPQGEVTLDADQQAVLVRTVDKAMGALHTMKEMVGRKRGVLDRNMAHNILYLTEHAVSEISQITGVQTDTAAQVQERYAKLREANLRIRALERQMGAMVGADAVHLGLRSMNEKLRYWWSREGFGHISEISFTDYGGCVLVLSAMLSRYTYTGSTTPASDKISRAQWLESLVARGFALSQSENGCDDPEVLDSPETRRALVRMLRETIPSARITNLETHINRDGEFCLRDIRVYVGKISEIEALAAPPSGKAEG